MALIVPLQAKAERSAHRVAALAADSSCRNLNSEQYQDFISRLNTFSLAYWPTDLDISNSVPILPADLAAKGFYCVGAPTGRTMLLACEKCDDMYVLLGVNLDACLAVETVDDFEGFSNRRRVDLPVFGVNGAFQARNVLLDRLAASHGLGCVWRSVSCPGHFGRLLPVSVFAGPRSEVMPVDARLRALFLWYKQAASTGISMEQKELIRKVQCRREDGSVATAVQVRQWLETAAAAAAPASGSATACAAASFSSRNEDFCRASDRKCALHGTHVTASWGSVAQEVLRTCRELEIPDEIVVLSLNGWEPAQTETMHDASIQSAARSVGNDAGGQVRCTKCGQTSDSLWQAADDSGDGLVFDATQAHRWFCPYSSLSLEAMERRWAQACSSQTTLRSDVEFDFDFETITRPFKRIRNLLGGEQE